MAANYDISAELQSELQCCVCKDRYIDPVDLSCGHTFCRECVLNTFTTTHREYNEERLYLSCPICRKRYFTSFTKIKKLPVNLKLRNIVSAFEEKDTVKHATCEIHKKPFVLFCYDCDALKCLSCFLKSCTALSHKTEEVDDVANEIKLSIKNKVEQCSARLSEVTVDIAKGATMAELRVLTEEKLTCLVDRMDNLCLDLLEEERQDVEKVKNRLEGYLKYANSSLVDIKVDVETISVPEGSKLTGIGKACKEATESIKSAIDKFSNVLKEHGRDSEEEDRRLPETGGNNRSSNLATTPDTTTVRGAVACSSSADDLTSIPTPRPRWSLTQTENDSEEFEFEDLALELSQYNHHPEHMLGGGAGHMGFLNYDSDNHPTFAQIIQFYGRDDVSQTSNEENTALMQRLVFDQDIVNSIAVFPPDFVASTSNGCSTVSPGLFGDSLLGEHVKAVCLIPPSKVLVAMGNVIEVHRLDILDRNQPIYILPRNDPANSKFECIGVTGTGPTYYLASDTHNLLIHVWDTEGRTWCNPIDVGTMIDDARASFKMCVHDMIVYITILRFGQVRAVNLRGETLWCNDSAVLRPTGITVDNSNVYVCESHLRCAGILIMDLNGTPRQTILHNYLTRPYSVAVSNGKIAVVERYLRHKLQISPIFVLVFDFDAVMQEDA